MSTESQEDHASSAERPHNWFKDLRRRKVFRVMGAYGVGAWLTLQIVDVLSGAFPVPGWTVAAATIVLALGFPIVAALSWAFQVTPEGVVLDIDNAQPLSQNRHRLIHSIDVFIICILTVTILFLSFGDRFERNSTETIRIAVLPLKNLSDDKSITYLAEGIADDIRSRLYGVPQLLLAARTSSVSMLGAGFDIQTIGQRLTVEHVLEGTIRQSDDRIRVTVQLVDVQTGLVRWVKAYNVRIHDILEMQNTIALVVASQLELFLSKEVRSALEQHPTDNALAYDLYLQAREQLNRPRTAGTLDQANALLTRAIDEDPEFALAYSALCRVNLGRYFDTADVANIADAESNCRQAISLDPGLGEVHTALGQLYASTNQWARAEAAFEAAIDVDPRNVNAYTGMADVLTEQQRFVEAEERYKASIEVLPANWSGYERLAYFYLRQGRLEEAANTYQQVVDFTPANPNAYNNLGAAHYLMGDFAKAADNFRRSLELDPRRSAYSNTGMMYYFAGDFEQAVAMFEQAIGAAEADYKLWGNLADAQRFVSGLEQQARTSYQKAIELALAQTAAAAATSEDLTNLAWYHANLDDRVSAAAYLDDATSMSNRTSEEFYTAALVYTLIGEADFAEQAMLKAREGGLSQAIIDATPEFRIPASQSL